MKRTFRPFMLLCLAILASRMTVGLVPARASIFQPHEPILIDGNSGFTAANGVTRGSGTLKDPYVIEGWEIQSLQVRCCGIWVRNTDAHLVIRNVYIHNSESGIFLENIRNGHVENCTLRNNDSGFSLRNTSYSMVTRNQIIENGEGIDSGFSANLGIMMNNISSSFGYGIASFDPISDSIISNNTISHSGALPIVLGRATNVTVTRNNVSDNSYGMSVFGWFQPRQPSSQIIVADNIFNANSASAIELLYASLNITISRNTFSYNARGVFLGQGTGPGIRIDHNNFINNTQQAIDDSASTQWDSGYPSGGNFWSDYSGPDTCSGPDQDVCLGPDGIGDVPRVISGDSGALDRYPLMRPFASPVLATVKFDPSSIPLNSQATYLVALVELPEGFKVSELVLSSIRLNSTIEPTIVVPSILSSSGAQVLLVKFNMEDVKTLLPKPGDYRLQVGGNILTSANFRNFTASATVHAFSK